MKLSGRFGKSVPRFPTSSGLARRLAAAGRLGARFAARFTLIGLPIVLAARPLADPSGALRRGPAFAPHSFDIDGRHSQAVDLDEVAAKRAVRDLLNRGVQGAPVLQQVAAAPPAGNQPETIGPFTVVGNVAILAADETMVTRTDTGYGVMPYANLAAVSRRFIATFGDDYDQITVFLAFTDRLSSRNALGYLQLVKNDTRGIGLDLRDHTADFGSKGRMQAVMNMKRIGAYGREAADDDDNYLYSVWAQETAHRWLVYFKLQRPGEAAPTKQLLGRQESHWSRGVESQGSIMDGNDWKDNKDGTYTIVDRIYRYGILDQYAMGLIKAAEVPPFFLLENLRDVNGTPPDPNPERFLPKNTVWRADRIDLTINDVIRGSGGVREPELDAAAQDLRMGVLLLGLPGEDHRQLVGEAFQIDNTRRLWTDFYNKAGGGRGKVCTQLLRPCRGDAFEIGAVSLEEGTDPAEPDGVLGHGERFALVAEVRNAGDKPARAELRASAPGLVFDAPPAGPMLEAGASATLTLTGRVRGDAACGEPVTVDLEIPGARGRSRELRTLTFGLSTKRIETFEGAAAPAGWRINPDGTDSGTAGRWAWAAPERTMALDYVLQPGAPFSGQRAFVTGAAGVETDNVEGVTTLESPAFALDGARVPTLSYQVYFVATELVQQLLVPAPAGALRVLASADGKPFTEIDRVVGMGTGWQRRLVRLPAKLGAALDGAKEIRFRFVAEETSQATRPVVEAAIDEVALHDEPPICASTRPEAPDGPAAGSGADTVCSCRVGAPATPVPTLVVLVLVLALAAAVRPRRRPPGGRQP